jgi:tripartite-type tricarboxylate transporter receptor subunit TctC
MTPSRKASTLVATFVTMAAVATLNAAPVGAQSWPTEPVKIVVPFPPGGTTDIMARLMADKLRVALGHSVVVDNIAGAGGRIGAERVARSAPDGHTLLLGSPGPMATYQLLYKSMPYDSRTAFDPVVLVATLPQVLVVRADSPVSTVQELIASMKEKAGATNYGTPGVGSSQHLTTELFMATTGTKAQNIAYKGSAPMLSDVMAGATDFAFDQLTSAMSLIKSGRLRALAVTSNTRSDEIPQVPTLKEAGVAVDYSVWFALAAPRGTPQPIIDRLNLEARKALESEDVKARIASFGAMPGGGSPSDLARVIENEVSSIKKILATTRIELD